MNTKIYMNNENLIAGISLKDESMPEDGNMALHSCTDPSLILQNRSLLAASIGCDLNQFVCANQTHSPNFYKVTRDDVGRGAKAKETAIENTDALYTFEPNIVLCTFTADCVPVILYDHSTGLVGVIHSGWQGTIKEITLKMIDYLKKNETCDPKNLYIHIGTAISQDKFEVDQDVYDQFKNLSYADEYMYFNEKTNKYHISNQQTVKRQCELAGVPSAHITIDETCTYVNNEGFSYREDKKAGRHLTFVMKKQ